MAVFVSVPVQAQPAYTFTHIADTTGTSVYCAGQNNLGTVIAVTLAGTPGMGPELRRWTDQTPTTIAQNVATICASINDVGQIAYGLSTDMGIGLLVRYMEGTESVLARSDEFPTFATTYLPAISANGSVLFHGSGRCSGFPAPPPLGIYVAPSGAIVYDCTDFAFDYTSALSMNDSQMVVFTGRSVNDGAVGIYRGPGSVPLVANTQVLAGLPVINNANAVAFAGVVNGQYGLFRTGDGLAFTRIDRDGAPIQASAAFSINDSGDVAFEATDQSAPFGLQGIFIGPSGDLRPVITQGMDLHESTVASVRMWPESLNNKGQVVFLARLADGREGIFRAEPPDTVPPVVTAPLPITVTTTEASGARGADSAELAAFLSAGSAVDNADSNPLRLAPQVNGVNVDNTTLFAVGTTEVAFRFEDASANIGTATSTVHVTAPACAVDITGGVTFSDGRTQLNKRTGLYTLQIRLTLANSGPASITGPVSLVMDGLPPGVVLRNPQGTTTCAAPAGSPYVNVNIGADSVWSRKERISVDLEFSSPSSSISFSRRVLAGAGGR